MWRGIEVLSAAGFGLLAAVAAPSPLMVLFVGLVAVAIGTWSRGFRVGLWGLAVLVVVSAVRAVWVDGHWWYLPEELPPALLRAGVPWLAAVAVRQYVLLGRQADQQRDLRRRERVAEIERRSTAERLALAQSLHDDVGHSLSLVALTVGRLELDQSLTESSREALSTARREIGNVVERLGNSVVSLRAGVPLRAPDTESATTVINRARAAGAHIDVAGFPDDHRLTAFGRDVVARFLRETITNATRHAPGEAITIHATDTGNGLRLRVSNRIRHGYPVARSSGTGLADLSRTLTASGGALEAERRDDRFVVTATVPATEDTPSTGVRDGDATDGVDRGSATRARRRLVVATTALIVTGLAIGEATLYVQKSRTVLSAEGFASISVGDAREDVLPRLPDQELPLRRGEIRQPGCHYYAVTADSFNTAAGDVHAVCFERDVVSAVKYINGEDR